MSKKKFNITVEMEERWVSYFQSMLKHMEHNGKIGHSGIVAFYSDGDGDFRPTFDFDIPFEKVDETEKEVTVEKLYDAG